MIVQRQAREQIHSLGDSTAGVPTSMLAQLRELAVADDNRAVFPVEAFALMRSSGLLTAVLPHTHGGQGLGWHPSGTAGLTRILMQVGGAHLAVARLYEGHVNAFALLWHYGSSAQRDRLCRYVQTGGLLAVWNAPSPEGPLRLVDTHGQLSLCGQKIYASGAGTITRPLLTATSGDGRLLMLWPDVRSAAVDLSQWRVHGMRASATGTLTLDHVPVEQDDIFGDHDDYHRQPMFSAGAWRFLAAQWGAAAELHELTRISLLAAGRADDPHQRARLAEAAIGIETARLWVEAAAQRAEQPSADPASTVAYVGMARLAVERVAMETIALAQRSVGLRALMDACPMERIARDLATYVRQPVPDLVRDGVAAQVLADDRPALDRWL